MPVRMSHRTGRRRYVCHEAMGQDHVEEDPITVKAGDRADSPVSKAEAV